MTATDDTLRFEISSDSFENIARIKYVIVTHLEKFAFREQLEIAWKDDPLPPETNWEELGGQLRNPTGEGGRKTGVSMNHANMGMILRAFELAAPGDGQQLLEIGPGNGAHLPKIKEKWPGLCYTGIEISETMIQEASGTCKDLHNVAFLMTDGQSLPFAGQSFDRIITVNTLYFWENPAVYAREILRVLKPGGVLCIAFVPEEFMERLPFTRFGFELYDLQKVSDLLVNAGFRVKDTLSETEIIRSNTGEKVERERAFILLEPGEG